ncbi:MAG: hypothetical protein A3G87_03540 [Omnitrophica bacterium RIFCSPLOWO2_12_FULL_50_11]|nr:MAG: hypothetical protein A3G87_03540 [Omnitrophica bacterium RIFCSPLOWO2_12_FULL_50_11]
MQAIGFIRAGCTALIDRARSSIVISMYLVRPGEDPKHPVNRLLHDLIEARRRGVSVTIYLNTKFKGQNPVKLVEGPWFDRLRESSVEIKLVSPVRRLHDKLVIVDRRFVVEGSTNWSVAAIQDNLESATIIESAELAEAKLRRIGFFPIWGEERKAAKAEPEALFPAGPPSSIEIPAVLMGERRYFPSMITDRRERAFKVFLLLLYLCEASATCVLEVAPEAIGEFLGILIGKDRSSIRRQIIRVLRELESVEGLVRSQVRHGKTARVELLIPEGPTFAVGSDELQPGQLAVLTDNAIFRCLMTARLRAQGRRLEDLTLTELKNRFYIHPATYKRALELLPATSGHPAR